MTEAPIDVASIARQLARTPNVLDALLADASDRSLHADEGPGTWSPYGIVGHLIHGEKTDWIPRARHILSGNSEPFEPFDREAQNRVEERVPIERLLGEFRSLREANLETLRSLEIAPEDLAREGLHPALGTVTLGQLLSTWAVHDLGHIAQISRVLAASRKSDVGPWVEYLPILTDRERRG